MKLKSKKKFFVSTLVYYSELCGTKMWHQDLANVINSDDDFHIQIFELIFNLNFFAPKLTRLPFRNKWK